MSTPHDREHEKQVILRLRQITQRLAGDTWHIDADDDGYHIVAHRTTGEKSRILTLHPDASADEQDLVAGALDHLFLLLGTIGRAVDNVRELRGQLANMHDRGRKENWGFTAKALCDSVAFWRFLEGKGPGGAIASAQAADTRMKFILNIKSKSELNDDLVARQRFLKLRTDFQDWQKGWAA